MSFTVVTKEELKAKIDRNEPVQILNVLPPAYWREGSIVHSKKIPLDELDNRLGELDKSKEVIAYCANYQCQASRQAATRLSQKGFNVKAYEGGIEEWKLSGYPMEQ